jgi:DNA-binding NarL/FixJ family response regulator
MLKLWLVDDHEIVRRGLRELLEANDDLEVVGEAGTFDEAMQLPDLDSVDVVILDVRLPDGNGVDLCRDLRSLRPDLACLILTSYADDDAMEAAVLAGARGYVLKDIRGNDLVNAIRAVSRGESLLSADALAHAQVRLQRRATEDARLASLSPQELRILNLLSEGMTNREIGDAMFLAEKTVKNYVSNLLAKLGFKRRTEAALFAQSHTPRRPGEDD